MVSEVKRNAAIANASIATARVAARIASRPKWKCAQCGVAKLGTVHQMRHTYCSKECMSVAYSELMTGSNNPNYKNAAERQCEQCGDTYLSYQKRSKFCSPECYSLSKPRVPKRQLSLRLLKKPVEPAKRKPKLIIKCERCTREFRSFPSGRRRYCSYACFVDSGGPIRAGAAAKAATMRYGAKKDANHREIFAIIAETCPVLDLSSVGGGVPDGIAFVRGGWQLFDVKNPKTGYGRRGLNKLQKHWVSKWRGGNVYLIYTDDDAHRFVAGEFASLKYELAGTDSGQAIATVNV